MGQLSPLIKTSLQQTKLKKEDVFCKHKVFSTYGFSGTISFLLCLII